MSIDEFELMKKQNTLFHLEKLTQSSEFKQYIKNKIYGKTIEETNDEIKFSDED